MADKTHILIIQHTEQAPGAYLQQSLGSLGAQITIVHQFRKEPIPTDSNGYHGLVVLGGPQYAGDDEGSPHFPKLLELMQTFDREQKPVLGICLGCQLLARAHGGQTTTMESLELGFIQHRLTEEGGTDLLTGGVDLPPLMEFHQDSFDLPDDGILLVEGSKCRNQCFRVGNCSWGFQFHLEVDETVVKGWLSKFIDGNLGSYQAHRDQFSPHDIETMQKTLPDRIGRSKLFCRQIAGRWLDLAAGKRGIVHTEIK